MRTNPSQAEGIEFKERSDDAPVLGIRVRVVRLPELRFLGPA